MTPRPFRPSLSRLESRLCLSGPATTHDLLMAGLQGCLELTELIVTTAITIGTGASAPTTNMGISLGLDATLRAVNHATR